MQENSIQPQVTNLDYLSELCRGDRVFLKEMIRIFLEENPREIQMLEDGIRDRNFQNIHLAAHKLRSTLPFVGIERLIEKEIMEIESIAVSNSTVQKIEIAPDDNPDIRKIEIVTTDRNVLQKIEDLFPKVKEVCERARLELAG